MACLSTEKMPQFRANMQKKKKRSMFYVLFIFDWRHLRQSLSNLKLITEAVQQSLPSVNTQTIQSLYKSYGEVTRQMNAALNKQQQQKGGGLVFRNYIIQTRFWQREKSQNGAHSEGEKSNKPFLIKPKCWTY